MSTPSKSELDFERWEREPGQDSGMRRAVASAAMVNRTHRIVRERAVSMQARKSQVRSLWIPLAMSGSLLSLICFAVWSIFEQNDVTPNGLPDASQQMFVFLMWCLPVTAAVLAVVWYRRNYQTRDGGAR
jgi:hypothetical protein